MTGKRKMATVHVTPFLFGAGWQIKVNGRRVGRFVTQADAEACGIFLAKLMAPASFRPHDRLGRFKKGAERTYSRSDDPPESPG